MMDGKSLSITEDKQNALRQLFPEVFSEGKIDWEKLKATLGEDITFSNERYVLNWAGKSDAFKVLQAPTTKTLIPAKDESINFDETENIFIEGENLEVLKVLQKSYFGKIKMIYIDPPYNTGGDSFIYPDKFSETKEEYLKRVGDKDEEGYMTKDGMFKKNSKENGQYHSNWLNMMYPRLFLAKNLLKEDGVIFVSIDDNEVHNLRLLLNEIFGEENFISELIVVKSKNGIGDKKGFATNQDYVLCFQKSDCSIFKGESISEDEIKQYDKEDSWGKYKIDGLLRKKGEASKREDRPNMYYPLYFNPITGEVRIEPFIGFEEIYPKKEDGSDGRWVWGKSTCKENIHKLYAGGKGTIYVKNYLFEDKRKKTRSILDSPEYLNDRATNEIKDVFDSKTFNTPKPIKLISTFIENICNGNDIILDFFAGSNTTAHAVMDLNKEDGGNRKYICVQLPELCDDKSEAFNAGYKTIADIAKERIRRVIGKINEEKETLGKETATLMEKVAELQQQIEDLKKNQPASIFNDGKQSPEIEKLIKQQETARDKANENIEKMDKIDQCDKGFKVLKLEDSNFKQWLQINGKDSKALEEQMKLFIDPVAENATIENMVYELLLKSGKDLNCKIEQATNYFKINENELVFMLEKATQEIIDAVLKEKPLKVVALDKLFKGNDQLKTNTVLQMKDAGVEFKTI